jgi:hypothetical protein
MCAGSLFRRPEASMIARCCTSSAIILHGDALLRVKGILNVADAVTPVAVL